MKPTTAPPPHRTGRPSPFWAWSRRLLATALALGTAIPLAIVVENARGSRALRQLERELKSAGMPLGLEDLAPPEVPEDRNLASAPGLAPLLAYRRDPVKGDTHWEDPVEFARLTVASVTPPEPKVSEPAPGNWTRGEPVPMAAWQAYYRTLAARTNRAETAARSKEGRPVLPADVAARYGVPADLSPQGLTHFLRYRTFPVPPTPGNPADDVLKALELAGVDIDVLQAALPERPECRFPLHYSERPAWSLFLPHLAKVRQLTTFLRLRACARLSRGESTGALRDVELAVRLSEGLQNEPFQISHWVRGSCIEGWLQPVWEGLAAHRWAPQDLGRLDLMLSSVEPQSGITRVLLGALHVMDGSPMDSEARDRRLQFHTQRPWREESVANGTEDRAEALIRWAPQGWFDQNRVRSVRRHWQVFSNHLAWSGTPAITNWLHEPDGPAYTSGPYTFLDYEFDPRISSRRLLLNVVRTTAWLRLARTAIALERHRLARGGHPAALDELVPAFLPFLPADPIDQAPLRYRRLPDGRFSLHSIGLDARDDAGLEPDPANEGDALTKPGPGDWVWPVSPNP